MTLLPHRDEAQAKLGQLREKAEKDVAQHGAEMKELQRVLDHDRRLRQFLAIKAQERSLTQEALEARQRRGAGGGWETWVLSQLWEVSEVVWVCRGGAQNQDFWVLFQLWEGSGV